MTRPPLSSADEQPARSPVSAPADIPSPSAEELVERAREPREPADWGRRLSAVVTGFASVVFAALASLVTFLVIAKGREVPVGGLLFLVGTLYALALGCGFMTWRFVRDRGLALDRHAEPPAWRAGLAALPAETGHVRVPKPAQDRTETPVSTSSEPTL